MAMTHSVTAPPQRDQRQPFIQPDDAHNRELVRQTHPLDWVNPQPRGRYHLVVIGAGTAGLTAAGGCAAIGGRVALIERRLSGGDCLVTGCVPSKGIISAARVAATIREAATFGIQVPAGTAADFPAVMERMRRLRAGISPADSVHRLREMGVDVYLGHARFLGPDAVEVDGAAADGGALAEAGAPSAGTRRLQFARAVIATGGRAFVPPIPGLQEAGFLTNETLFELTQLPLRFVMIGAGPIGCEMAQTFARLGSQVTLVNTAPHILTREDADAAELVQRAMQRDGVQVLLNAKIVEVTQRDGGRRVVVEQQGHRLEAPCDAMLVGVGRSPNVEGLDLEAAGVAYDARRVKVNDALRTTNPRIFAAGDVCAPFQFTHTANVLGRMAMMNALFPFSLGGRMSRLVVPWCTYTDPELAHVGWYERQAAERGLRVETLTVPFADNDRAVLDGVEEGFIRVHLQRGTDRILGATVVGAHAGELLTYFTLAMASGKGLTTLAGPMYPYPTQAELVKKLANQRLTAKLTPGLKWWLSRLLALGR
jgi:pyruvate/2-oxoglutarate dehydrogenase complex dihydrolipoamide dehydrogenase (E3) component